MNALDLITPQEAKTLSGLFKARVKRSPQRTAFRYYDKDAKAWHATTWQSMAHEVGRWQAALADEGLQVGDRVAIMLPNCREWVMFEQAALALGMVVIPLYTNDRPDNVAYIIDDANVKLLFIDDEDMWNELEPIHDKLNKLTRVLALTAIPHDASVNLRSVDEWLPPQPDEFADDPRDPNELATIVYTSGTTGRPKGVMLSHYNILWNAYSGLQSISVYPQDVFLSFLPLSHTLERTSGYYLPMMAGATIAYARSIPHLGEDLLAVKPTIFFSVPRIFERVALKVRAALEEKGGVALKLFELAAKIGWQRFLYQQGRRGWSPAFVLWPVLEALVARKIQEKLGGCLRFAVSGGAPLPFSVARVFISLGVPIVQGYGMTESSPVISVNKPDDNEPQSVGVPLQDVEVKVAENGELLARSPGIMLGYWGNEEATKTTIDEQGWLHTGDKGEVRDGRIYITGRLKEIIVLANGEKVPPADMESAITMDPLFEQVMIIGECRPYLGALVVLNEDKWRQFVSEHGGPEQSPKLLEDTKLKSLVLERIGLQLRTFPGYAQVRAVALSLEPWVVENELLTPTLKLRRSNILAHFGDRVDALYHGH